MNELKVLLGLLLVLLVLATWWALRGLNELESTLDELRDESRKR